MIHYISTMKQPTKWLRVQLVAPPEFVSAVDKWRRKQPDLPNRSEAIRRLTLATLKDKRNA